MRTFTLAERRARLARRVAASLGEVFREVGRGADYGVVPVEEASEGLVTHALDYFLDSDLLIVGDANLATTISDAIKDQAADDPDFAKQVTESAARVVAMKARRGLARC